MITHRTQAIVGDGGSVTVQGLPLPSGQKVDVIVLAQDEASRASTDAAHDRLKGSVLKDQRPFDPVVPPEEWDVVR